MGIYIIYYIYNIFIINLTILHIITYENPSCLKVKPPFWIDWMGIISPILVFLQPMINEPLKHHPFSHVNKYQSIGFRILLFVKVSSQFVGIGGIGVIGDISKLMGITWGLYPTYRDYTGLIYP